MKSNIMLLDYVGVTEINGSLIVIDDVENASFEEVVEIRLADGSMRQGDVYKRQLLPLGAGKGPLPEALLLAAGAFGLFRHPPFRCKVQ